MWTPNLPGGFEARKCRYRVASLCRGVGLDLSCAEEKIVPAAIAVGLPKDNRVDIQLDLSANDCLRVFSSDHFDYIFDAHHLEDFKCTEAILREWWRVIKYGGYLILYEQDKDFYPHVGTPGSKISRQQDLYWQDVWDIVKGFGNAKLVSASRHNDSNEYSWQLVIQKKFSVLKKPFDYIKVLSNKGKVCFPREKKRKEALLIRYGGLGDMVWTTPVLRKLKEDGYYVVVNTTERGAPVLEECPYVDEFIIHKEALDVQYDELDKYWNTMGRSFDKVINLTKSVEGALIKCEGDEQYHWPHEKRHAECNVNFQDRTMEIAGYPNEKGCLPELRFTEIEEHLARIFRDTRKEKFVILWALSGSAFHKTYHWSEYVAGELAFRHKRDMEIITVGDETCKTLELWKNPIVTHRAGMLTVRQSFILTKYVDLVIGPDTGVLNAASCFDTPKIIFLSTNSVENMTKYWKNTTSLWAEDCECYPCHRLIYTNSCPKGNIVGVSPKCMENLKPEVVIAAIEKYYNQWKAKQAAKKNALRIAAMTIADDELTHRLAARVRTSFKKFHPDIPFFTFDARDEKQILGEIRESAQARKSFEIRPRFMSYLLQDYDLVIYLDADTVVTARLDEFLEGDYDVAGSLNINVSGGPDDYLNAGVSAITSDQFCREWTDLMYRGGAGRSNQVYFNQLAHSDRYRLKVVDDELSYVYYNERSRPFWKDLYRDNGKLFCDGRWVKVLHWAGGSSLMKDKLSSKDFSPQVREYLNEVTGTTDFTDIEGVEVSKWMP